MGAAAALQIALGLLPSVTTGVSELIAWINSLKSALQQSGEWTDIMDLQYRQTLYAKTNDPAYQL